MKDRTVLLVEDQAVIAMEEAAFLESCGLRVVKAFSGEGAVQAVAEHPEIDLVLMDIDLGAGMDGTDAAEMILAGYDLPLIFLSGHTEPEVVERTERITSYGYVTKDAGHTVLLAAIRMAFRLHEARRMYKETFDHSINGLCIHRMLSDDQGQPRDCEYVSVNPAFTRHTGLDSAGLPGRTVKELYPGAEGERVVQLYASVLASGKARETRYFFQPTGKWFDLTIFPLRGETFTVVVQDITDRVEAERTLREEREFFSSVMEISPVGITTVDAGGHITYANRRAEEILGLSRSEITNRTYDEPAWRHTDLDGSPFPDEKQPFNQVKESLGTVYDVQHGITWPDGKTVFLSINGAPLLDEEGGFQGMVASLEDITRRREADAQIRGLLEEKEVLFRELQHRIKNNLSSLAGLLRIEAETLEDEGLRERYQILEQRIRAMAILQDKLHQGKNLRRMQAGPYLRDLHKSIREAFNLAGRGIDLVEEYEDLELSVDNLQACGLLSTELISNGVKHAFGAKPPPGAQIRISLAREASGSCCFSVEDNGRGYQGAPGEKREGGGAHFGETLIQVMSEQLGGRLERENRREEGPAGSPADRPGSSTGMKVSVTFPSC